MLVESLTADQRRRYAAEQCFDVIGGDNHGLYRIFHHRPTKYP
jgi:hypothetical protein